MDIYNAAEGQYTVIVLESYHIISDGELTIELTPTGKMNHAKINAIVIDMIASNPDMAMDSKISMRKIDHPAFVLKAVYGDGIEVKQKVDDNNNNNSTDPDGLIDDVLQFQIDDAINIDTDDEDNTENTPTYSPTVSNFPTYLVRNDDAINNGNETYTYVNNDNFNTGFYDMLEENSVHINVGQEEPYRRSTTSNIMWFEDGQFIKSPDKGSVLNNCIDSKEQIAGLTEFGNDTFVGCNERFFGTTGIYEIPLPVNIEETITFNVTLYFAEMFFDSPGQRLFDVLLGNETVLRDFDIYEMAGGKDKWYKISHPVVVADGLLDISLIAKLDNAKIDAIIVHPMYKTQFGNNSTTPFNTP